MLQPEPATSTPRKRPRARGSAAIGAVALAALLVGGSLAALAALRDEPEPLGFEPSPTSTADEPLDTPSPEPTATPTPTPAGPATAAPTPAPTAEPPAAETVALEPVSFALNTVDRLSLRASPGLDGERLGSLSADSVSVVLDGPLSADGYTWYQLSGLGMPYATGCAGPLPTDPWEQAPLSAPTLGCPVWLGWVAAASLDGEPWLVPVSREDVGCSEAPLTADDFWSMGNVQPLGCFAGQEVTVRGWYPLIPSDTGLGGACSEADLDAGWLICQNINYDALASDDTYWEGPLRLNIDPASGVSMPARGQWLEITGFYDHPLARRCGDHAAAYSAPLDPDYAAAFLTLQCRQQFVVSDVRVVSGP